MFTSLKKSKDHSPNFGFRTSIPKASRMMPPVSLAEHNLLNGSSFTFVQDLYSILNRFVIIISSLKELFGGRIWCILCASGCYSKLNKNSILKTGPLAYWEECSAMPQETGVQSHVESCQRLKKGYLTLPCLTHYYEVRSKGKVRQSRERSISLPYISE